MVLIDRMKRGLANRREGWPWLDHIVRAAIRYKGDGGDRLAASLTFYSFLSLFPLLLLGVSVLGFALNGREQLQEDLFSSLVSAVPGLADTFSENLDAVRENAGKTGLIALAGVLFAGLGGISALRDSLRLMWHQDLASGNFVKSRLRSVVLLAGLGATLLVSIGVSTVASSLLDTVLAGLGLDSGPVVRAVAGVATVALALGADILLFLYVFRRLPKIDWPFRRVLRGAVFGAVGFGVLKLVATYYVGRAASSNSELYGPVGAVIGILVGLNLMSRFVLFTAAWTVTAPGCDDVLPSGTALEPAPEELTAASEPCTPQFATDAPLRTLAGVTSAAEDRLDPSAAGRVRTLAGVTLGVAGTVASVVLVKGLRAVWGTVRSS